MELLNRIMKEVVKGILAFVSCSVGIWGYYPILPAYFAVCSMDGRAPISVIVGAALGMFVFMPLNSLVRYVFAMVVIGLSVRFFLWLNHSCDSSAAGIIAGISVIAMNFAGIGMWEENGARLLMGICEGIMVYGLCVGIHALLGIPFRWDFFRKGIGKAEIPVKKPSLRGTSVHRMESLAYAVSGLSDALFSMSIPKNVVSQKNPMTTTAQEMCESCNSRELCWKEHHGQALKQAWNNRLLENRYIIAQQLDAMADLMKEWTRVRISTDHKFASQMAAIVYGAKEKGLMVEDLHIYDEKGRLCIESHISTKWDGGIPIRNYIRVVEKVFGRSMRVGADVKNILTGEPELVCLYEDTLFYVLQGSATEKKCESEENGDSFSCFHTDDGNYHICLSDGMGSGSKAKEESEMVIELMQKFIEAGFQKETAIKLMNSAMVLQGEENSFSTLDYGVIHLYSGELELVKIGGAATFIKHGDEVECIDTGSLPAGADARMEVETMKRQLRSGDFLVMVTDGMIEYLHVRNPKELMKDMIARVKTEHAKAMAEQIMTQVMVLTGGFPKDDMTILVIGIWEK